MRPPGGWLNRVEAGARAISAKGRGDGEIPLAVRRDCARPRGGEEILAICGPLVRSSPLCLGSSRSSRYFSNWRERRASRLSITRRSQSGANNRFDCCARARAAEGGTNAQFCRRRRTCRAFRRLGMREGRQGRPGAAWTPGRAGPSRTARTQGRGRRDRRYWTARTKRRARPRRAFGSERRSRSAGSPRDLPDRRDRRGRKGQRVKSDRPGPPVCKERKASLARKGRSGRRG